MIPDSSSGLLHSVPVWMRWILAFAIILVGSFIWGFLMHILGLPTALTALGAPAIGALVIIWLFPIKKLS